MSLEPASDEGLSLGAGGAKPQGPEPGGNRVGRTEEHCNALHCACRIDAKLPSSCDKLRPASGHRGATSQERCATDRPETASPIQHRPARALGRAVGRAWFGLVDRDSYVGGAAQCAGFACDHHAGRTRVGL